MDADAAEISVSVEVGVDGKPVTDYVNGIAYCRLSWAPRQGPPMSRGIYLWMSDDYRVLYVGKATSDRTSHLYRRITAYKRASPKKTQWTSLRLNADILAYVRSGARVRLLCLVMHDAAPIEIGRVEAALIAKARPPWNRQNNPQPRSVEEAMPLTELLGIATVRPLPTSVILP